MSAPYKNDLRAARGGWAPGGYIRTCTVCKEEFVGDKRAWVCADCAYKEPTGDSPRHCDQCDPSFFCWGMSDPALCVNPTGVPEPAVRQLSEVSDAELQAKIDTPDEEEKVAMKIVELFEGDTGMPFRKSICDRMLGIVNEYSAAAREKIADLEFEVRDLKEGRQSACTTVAAMHKAAVGEISGPIRGVVEDVEDVRLRAEKAEAQVAVMQTALRTLLTEHLDQSRAWAGIHEQEHAKWHEAQADICAKALEP